MFEIPTIFFVIAGVLAIAAVVKKISKKKDKPDPVVVTPPVVTPTPAPSGLPDLTQRRIIFINDFRHFFNKWSPGDPDSSQDQGMVLAACHHFDIKPLAIGCSWNKGQPRRTIPAKLLELSGMSDVPTILGASIKGMRTSPLSEFIVSESHKAPLTIASGGTTSDIATAIRDGANINNITVVLTPGTWNADNSEGSTEYILNSGVKIKQTPKADLWHKLAKYDDAFFRIKGLTAEQWIDNKRDLAMWDLANHPATIADIQNMNTTMSDFRDGHPIRAADDVHFLSALGVGTNQHAHHYNIIDNGIAKMRARGL